MAKAARNIGLRVPCCSRKVTPAYETTSLFAYVRTCPSCGLCWCVYVEPLAQDSTAAPDLLVYLVDWVLSGQQRFPRKLLQRTILELVMDRHRYAVIVHRRESAA